MSIWLSRKDRRIANLKAMIHNRDEEIEALLRKIEYQDNIIKVSAEINAELQEEKKLLDYRLREKICMEAHSQYSELKSDLENVLEQVLGAFQQNWCIDWNFSDIREKYNISDNYNWNKEEECN